MKIINCLSKKWQYLWKTPLIILLLLCSATIGAQNQKISISKQHTIKEAFESIEKQTNFTVAYNESVIDVSRKLPMDIKDKPLAEALSVILSNTNNTYKIQGQQVLIITSARQNSKPGRKYTGIIKDDSDKAIIGATVSIRGTTNGIITDIDGRFSIQATEGDILLVSYVGFRPQEVKLGSQADFNIILTEDTKILEEIVVVGYGAVKKSDLTGAVASMSNTSIVRAGNINAAGAMQGGVPGVTITRSNNKPGGGYDIKIRGVNSITSSSSPLIVIDGMPGGSLDFVNPEDIEKIDVLKDASATAIYGSSGANGVVIVTTRKGQTGKPQISYNGYAGLRTYTNLPDMMSGDEYVNLAREAIRANNNDIYKKDEQIFTDPSELKAIQDGNYYDWLDAVSSPAFMTSHNISAIGGTEAVKYAFSGGYYFEDGMISPQEYTQYNLRSSVDLTINKHVSFGGNMYFVHSIREKGNWDLLRDVFRMRPTQHPNSLVTGEETWKYSSNNLFNPLVTSDNQESQVKRTNLQGNIYIKIKPVEQLEITSSFSPNFIQTPMGDYIGVWTKALQGTAKGAQSTYTKDNTTSWVWDNIVDYKWKKDIHSLNATGVLSTQKYQYDRLYASSKDLSYNSLWYNLSNGTMTDFGSGFSQWTMMSYVARLNYGLMNKYMLTASMRYDGSSKLAEGHKWAFFPSAALAWRINEEDFMKDTEWISNLKMRLSYGQAGNANSVSSYSSTGNISGSVYYPFGTSNVVGNLPANLPNPNLTWERTSEYNIGLDFGFFKDRISGNIEYYNRTTNDLIMRKTVPVHLGYSSVIANIGSVRNSGFELQLNTMNVKTKDFSWTSTINLAYNKNEIISLADEESLGVYSKNLDGMSGRYSDRLFVGQPVDINWNTNTIGVWQLGEETEAARYGAFPGNFRIKDYNADGVINDHDYFIDGKRTPDWTGGMTNLFRYKDFDFAVHMYFQLGAKAYNQFFNNFALEWNSQNFNNLRTNYWTPENPSNTMARPAKMGSRGNIAYEKTDFLKISYATLGYTLNKSILNDWGLKNMRFYLTVQNPLILTKFTGLDPEQPSIGNIGDTDAMSMNTLLGVNISF